MTNDDMERFAQAWAGAAEMQTGKSLSDNAIKLAFRVLMDLDIIEVRQALLAHCRKSRWMPTPSDILLIVNGELPSDTVLYGLAVDDDTVLGRIVKILGGDVARLSPYDGVRRCEMIRGKVQDFHERAVVGEYTERELRMIVAAGLDPVGRLAPGVSGPREPYRAAVAARAAQAVPEPQIEQKPDEMSDEQKLEGKKMLATLMKTLATGDRHE